MSTVIHQGRLDMSPGEAGFREAAVERLDALLQELIHDHRLQGASYLLSKGGRTFACKAMGSLKYNDPLEPLKSDSIRRVASLTKWFTLTAILRLMEEGKLYLTQPVKDWIPEFDHRAYEQINVFHLLTHTSGLSPDSGYFLEPYPFGRWEIEFAYGDEWNEDRPQRSPEEEVAYRKSKWIKAMLAGPPVCSPGEQWDYCSIGFVLLGEIIQRITGMKYEDYIQHTILEPLGMTRTFFTVPVHLHGEVCLTNEWEEKRLQAEPEPDWAPPRSGGGLYSTLDDLHIFGQMLLNQGNYQGVRILSRKSVERLSRAQYPKGLPAFGWGERSKANKFGLSTYLGKEDEPFKPHTIYHEGAGRCALMVDPDEDLIVSFFVPSDIGWVPESIINVKNIIWSGLQ
ncbi:MAG TPA: serine hydrolase domain-containing protein [Paenibacillus sp.]|jgi:CubicO group peptidase (beta-lactamase class C family)